MGFALTNSITLCWMLWSSIFVFSMITQFYFSRVLEWLWGGVTVNSSTVIGASGVCCAKNRKCRSYNTPRNEHVHSRRKVQPTKKMSIDIEDAYGVIRRITPYASSMSIVLIPRMRLRLRRPCYSMALFTLRCIASCMQDAMHRSVNGV